MEELNTAGDSVGLDVAVIGMSGRFPEASTIEAFWQNLRNGVESISFFSDKDLLQSGVEKSVFSRPNYVRARGILQDVDKFDASFFNFFPKEAETLDPQHRIFLECAWETLEAAGYYSENFKGLISLFAGVGMNTYIIPYLAATQGKIETAEGYQVSIGNEKDFLTTKVSYKLNLRGISMDVQSACSTSLTATYLAYQSLINYQSDMALAGGCTITLPQKTGFTYQEGMILSPDGHCRAFDADANGTIAGNGCGVVLLKRLEDALADNDYIYAVIKGGAANNDGSLKVGYTAPSVDGQADVIAEAQYVAGVQPEDISYIETHGTGTNLGDPIEITALTKAFRRSTDQNQFCAIGSVKPNVGHLDAAAGIVSLIKTALALKHKELPPSINYAAPNPKIDFENSPFYVNTELRKWETDDKPRLAGVSSFGIGGTNVHLILEEPPHRVSTTKSRRNQLILLSARSQEALSKSRENFVSHLKNNPAIDLADAAFTLQVGRKGFKHRMAVVCSSREEAIAALENVDPEKVRVQSHADEVEEKSVVFMFSGQGAQYVNMGRNLYEEEITFRECVDECCDILRPLLGLDLRDIMYPPDGDEEAAQDQLKQTKLAQPSLFVIEYALSELWKQWGITPQGMIGHSIGEYVAACFAGVMSLEDALRLVALRGELMQRMPQGAMLSAPLGEKEIGKYLNDDVSLAAVNADDLSVLSGPFEAIEALEAQMTKDNVEFTRLHTSHAFHSKMMDPILETFEQEAAKVALHEPQIPYISNVTGTWITVSEATDAKYYARHLRTAVHFSAGIGEMLANFDYIYLEVGPGKTLCTLARRNAAAASQTILPSVRHPKDKTDDQAFLLNSLGQLWLGGGYVNWEGFDTHEVRHRVPLPTYPFERRRYWLDVTAPTATTQRPNEKDNEISNWFYAPTWRRAIHAPQFDGAGNDMIYLIFSDHDTTAMQEQIRANTQRAVIVKSGKKFQQIDDMNFVVRPDDEENYEKLVQALKQNNLIPGRILYAWQMEKAESRASIKLGMYSLLWLVKKLDAFGITSEISIVVCATSAFDVTGAEEILPEHAILSGACKVIPQEYQNIRCRFVDAKQGDLHRMLAEFEAPPEEPVVAYRNNYRWLQHFQRCAVGPNTSVAKKKGVYLITGGLGDIGLAFSSYLAETYKAKLVLVDRVSFPEQKEWQEIKNDEMSDARLVEKISQVQEIEKNSEVLILKADITDEQQMSGIFEWTEKQFGEINGVIHAAGLVGSKATIPIQDTGSAECEKHLAAKVYGANVLAALLKNRHPDFVILQSSLSAILGGMGMYAYAGVNAYLDAFAAQQQRQSGTHWVSVNWDGWKFAKEAGLASRTSMDKFIIDPREGVEAFNLLLQNISVPQIAISTGDLDARFKKWVVLERGKKEAVKAADVQKLHPRPNLTTPYAAPRNKLEEELVSVWGDLLGIEGIGIYDDFFDLGGHSLLATQLVSRLRDAYKVELPLSELFESPTVATLSESISKSSKTTADEEEAIADILNQVDNLSEEEVKELLRSKENKK